MNAMQTADEHTERLELYSDKEAAWRALLALDAGKMGSWRWDIGAGTVTGDPFVAELLNLDYANQPWPLESVFASMHPDDLDDVQSAVDEALSGGDDYEVEFRDRVINSETGEEGVRWLGARGRVTNRASDGTPLEMIGVNWDATEQRTQQERLTMLASEMDHRVKNAFAVIRSLINLGERIPGDKTSFADTLRNQVHALADAHVISSRSAEIGESADPVPARDILQSALRAWLENSDGSGPRVEIETNKAALLPPNMVSAFSMLVYELVTNATKYGALSLENGLLKASAQMDEEGSFIFRWTEHGYPHTQPIEVTSEEIQPSFGMTLMKHCVTMMGGTHKFSLKGGALEFEMRGRIFQN